MSPKLQASIYPLKKLGEISKIARGSSPRPIRDQKYFENGTIPWIKIADATASGKYLYKTKQYVNEYGASFSRKLPSGSVIIAASGTLGYTQVLGVEGCIHDGWLYFSDLEKLDEDFLYYVLLWMKNYFFNQAYGAAIQNINTDILKNTKIPYPQLLIQQKIASILSTYDDLIENNNHRIAILEEMAQKLYREWFVKFRFPGHEDVKMVGSELGEIPEGWKVVSLEDVCTRITDGSHKSPKSVDVGVPMASVKDMHDFGLNLDSCRQISQEDFEELARNNSKVVANDILVAKDGSYLKHTFVVEKDLDVALLSSIAILTPSQAIKPHLLAYCLRSKVVKERMKQCVSGVAIPRIILKDFRKFKIILPPNEMQVKWNLLVEQTVKMCWNLTSKNYNLKQQRELLLSKLISGKIDVNHNGVKK